MRQITILSFLLISFFSLEILATDPGDGYKVGDIATDFSLKNIDGEMVSLSDYESAEGYIVIFTCNTCPWAVKYEDRIIDLHQKFSNDGFPVIAINPNDPSIKPGDSFSEMKVRASEKGFEFPYVFDEKQEVFPAYGATKTPHVYVLDKERMVKYIGAIDDSPRDPESVSINYIENAVKSIRMGKTPDPATTKAIGCSIKSKKA